MPKLITEILREVFIDLLGNELENAKHIERFMLSGVEAFEVAINFFSTAIRVTVIKDDFLVLFPTGPHLFMSYDCVVLKPILKSISNSVERLEFRKGAVGAGENIVYDTLIKEGLKSVYFYRGHEVPENYMEKIRNNASLESVEFQDKLSILDLSYIRPPPNSDVVVYMSFADIVSQNFDNICFPQVENLDIVGNFQCSVENSELIPSVIAKIIKVFPNLKTLKASFGNLLNAPAYYSTETTYQIILQTMDFVNHEMFAFIPEAIKGFFHLQCFGIKYDNEDIHALIAEKEGFRVNEDGHIEKHFIIHENMEFSFFAAFNVPEDSADDESDSDNQGDSDSDDHVIYMETDDEGEKVEAMIH